MRTLSLLLVGVFLLLGGCATTKYTKSQLLFSENKASLLRSYEEPGNNSWRDCFNAPPEEIKEDFVDYLYASFSEELDSIPQSFFTETERVSISRAAATAGQMKLWAKYKNAFSLDKNINNKQKLKFCQTVKKSYEGLYGQ